MGAGFWSEVSSKEGREREKRHWERERERGREGEIERFFIFARDAYLMIFPQTDRQTQRETHRTHLRV